MPDTGDLMTAFGYYHANVGAFEAKPITKSSAPPLFSSKTVDFTRFEAGFRFNRLLMHDEPADLPEQPHLYASIRAFTAFRGWRQPRQEAGLESGVVTYQTCKSQTYSWEVEKRERQETREGIETTKNRVPQTIFLRFGRILRIIIVESNKR